MKNIVLALSIPALILSCSININAQQKLSEFSVKIPKPYEVYLSSDSSGNLVSIFQSNRQLEMDFMDPEFNHVRSVVSQKVRADRNQKVIGATWNGDECTAYFYNTKVKNLSLLSVDRSSGRSSYSVIRPYNEKDQFLRGFEMNGQFYALFIPKGENVIKVLILNGNQSEETAYSIAMPGFYNALSNKNENLNSKAFSGVGIEDIRYDLENNIKSSYPGKKMYHFDNKIVMTFDEPALIHLVTIDLDTKTSDYKKLNFSLEHGNASNAKQGNSFLYKNRLFRSTISPDQLNISILDLDSMQLLNTFNFYPHQEISILNSPMILEGGIEGQTTDERIVKRTDQYFKRVLNGNLAIAANPIDNEKYELQVGSYEVYAHTPYRSGFVGPTISVGMGMGVGMGGFGYPYGGPYYPGSYNGFPGYYPSQSTVRQRSVYFKSLLGKDNFEHIKENIPTNMKDRINDYERRVFRSNVPDVLIVAPYGRHSLLMGYYVKNRRKFNIIGFKDLPHDSND